MLILISEEVIKDPVKIKKKHERVLSAVCGDNIAYDGRKYYIFKCTVCFSFSMMSLKCVFPLVFIGVYLIPISSNHSCLHAYI